MNNCLLPSAATRSGHIDSADSQETYGLRETRRKPTVFETHGIPAAWACNLVSTRMGTEKTEGDPGALLACILVTLLFRLNLPDPSGLANRQPTGSCCRRACPPRHCKRAPAMGCTMLKGYSF